MNESIHTLCKNVTHSVGGETLTKLSVVCNQATTTNRAYVMIVSVEDTALNFDNSSIESLNESPIEWDEQWNDYLK